MHLSTHESRLRISVTDEMILTNLDHSTSQIRCIFVYKGYAYDHNYVYWIDLKERTVKLHVTRGSWVIKQSENVYSFYEFDRIDGLDDVCRHCGLKRIRHVVVKTQYKCLFEVTFFQNWRDQT